MKKEGIKDIVIDACCLINLAAIADQLAWSAKLGLRFHVPKLVGAEALFLRVFDSDGKRGQQPVNLKPLANAGILAGCDLSAGPETAQFVEFARSLDDGEAAALAIALSRKWPIATDDRKATSLATQHGIEVRTTPRLLQRLAERLALSESKIGQCLRNIEARACFFPPINHPLRAWWAKRVGARKH